ncbi:MFS transporter [Microbacterium sediminicola]|uniref:MFS transporter n=1 Tax=Microbacterium sediminicola TaxID=415210 RepID=A0ABP4UBD0_9MICO
MLSMTQLVVVLDSTIVNIALPQAQAELGLTDSARQWVVTAYALAFGAFLLLGGRIADYAGRKLAYMIGMVGFGVASAYGGLVSSGVDLIIARALQGVFAALLAPAALALLTVTFPHGRERNRAFAVFGTVAGAGAATGLVLGGFLTEFADWRWCLLVNLIFVLIGVIAGAIVLSPSKAEGENRYDVAGAVTITLGLGALVYGFSLAENGWADPLTIMFLAAGVILLAAFVWIESRVAQPLLPLRVIADRVRGGALIVQALSGSVMIGTTLYLTFHLQIVLGMSALAAGVASLPLPFAITATAPLVTRLLPKTGPRPLMTLGPILAGIALFYLSLISPTGSYWVEVFPGLLLMGVGMGFIFVPLQNVALMGVAPHEAGAASAAVNSAMQIGGSIGLSVFTTIYVSVLAGVTGAPTAGELTAAYGATFQAAAIGMLAAALIAVAMIRRRTDETVAEAAVATRVPLG